MLYKKECLSFIIQELNEKQIKYLINEFPSGAYMIDIWYNNLFFVIQLEDKIVGFSEINSESAGFDTIPDYSYGDLELFKHKFKSVFQ